MASSGGCGDSSAAAAAPGKRGLFSDNEARPDNGGDDADSSSKRCRVGGGGGGGSGRGQPRPQLLRILAEIKRFGSTVDDVHLTIKLEPLIKAFIDTPHVQRLKKLRQLGAAFQVYMNAVHTRFEHSVGVAKLAAKIVRGIQENQEQLDITKKDVACLKLAGLLHDLGHGAYSHTYEHFVNQSLPQHLDANPGLKRHYRDLPATPGPNWSHEQTSLVMIDSILEYLGMAIDLDNLDAPLKQIGFGPTAIDANEFRVGNNAEGAVLTSRDMVFVKECIWGKPVPAICERLGQNKFYGREEGHNKHWMYDIVNNAHSGLDVDKIEYFARDERRAVQGSGDVPTVLLENACVAWGRCNNPDCKCESRTGKDGSREHLMICYPKKRVKACIDVVKKRFDLHSNIYKHKTNNAAAFLLCDILVLVDPFYRMTIRDDGNNGQQLGQPKREYDRLPISLAMLDMSTYLRLTDAIDEKVTEFCIDNQHIPDAKKALGLIDRYNSHDFYKEAAHKKLSMDSERDIQLWRNKSVQGIVQDMLNVRGHHSNGERLKRSDFIVEKIHIHQGTKDCNPLKRMCFVLKESESKLQDPVEELPVAVTVNESNYDAHLSRCFEENSVRIFVRCPSKMHLAAHVFEQYLEELAGEIEFNTTEALLEEEDGEGFGDGFGQQQHGTVLSQEEDEGFDDDEEHDDDEDSNNNRLLSPAPHAAAAKDGGTCQVTPVQNRGR